MKCNPASKGKSAVIRSSEKCKNEQTAGTGEYHRLSSKPPKASGQARGISTGQNERALMGKRPNIFIGHDKSVQTRPVERLMDCKKLSSSFSSTVSCHSNNSPRRAFSPHPSSNDLKRKTESRKTKLSASVSTSRTPSRYSEKGNRLVNLSLSTQSLSISNHLSLKSAASSIGDWSVNSAASSIDDWSVVHGRKEKSVEMNSNLNPTTTQQRTTARNEPLQTSDSKRNPHSESSSFEESEISSPVQSTTTCVLGTSTAPTESAESLKRSSLRMPSPTIGYFHEEKPVERTEKGSCKFQLELRGKSPSKTAARSRKTPPELVKSETLAETRNGKHGSMNSVTKSSNSVVQFRHGSSNGKLKRCPAEGGGFAGHLSNTTSNHHTISNADMEGTNCSKSRKVGTGKPERRRVAESSKSKVDVRKELDTQRQKARGSINSQGLHPIKNEKRNLSNTREKVEELSKLLEVIDLGKDMGMEHKQEKGFLPSSAFPEPNSLSFTEASLSSRTPLGDKTSVCNRNKAYGLLVDGLKEKSVEMHQFCPFEDIDKENS